MPSRIDNLFYELDLKKQDFDRALAGAQKQLRKLGTNTGAAASQIDRMDDRMRAADRRAKAFRTTMVSVGGVLAAIGLKRLAEDLFETATAVEETGAKFNTVFGAAALQLDQFIDSFAVIAGLSRQQARELLASTGAIAQGFGFARQESADFAQEIITLAADLASFNNLQGGAAEAARILQAALAGERESLKRLGIVFLESDVQQRALLNTAKTNAKQLTQQEKATASLQLITERAGVAVGDLARTQDSAANQARALSAELQNMKDDISVGLLPAFSSLLKIIRDTIEGWKFLVKGITAFDQSMKSLSDDALQRLIVAEARRITQIERAKGATDENIAAIFAEINAGRANISMTNEQREAFERLIKARELLLERQQQRRRADEEVDPQIAPVGGDDAGNKKAAAQRAKLEEQLADRVAKITLTATELQLREIGKLRDAYRKAFGTIGEEAEKNFRILEDAAAKAGRELRAQELAKTFGEEMEAGLREITIATAAITDEEERRTLVLENQERLFEIQLYRVEQQLKATDATVEEEEALRAEIAKILVLLQKVRGEQTAITDQAKTEAQQRFQNLVTTLSLLRQAADGAIDFANAMGLVGDETAETLDNITQIAVSAATLAAAIASTNVPGIISGSLGLLGGLAGLLGESAEDRARRQVIEQNTRALRELGENVDRLRGTFEISGADFAGALRALEQTFLSGAFGGGLSRKALLDNLRRLGLSMADLDRIAAELGITIRDDAGKLIQSGLRDLRTALQELEDELIGFPDTFEGFMRRLQLGFEILDIEGPLAQFEALRQELAILAKTGRAIPLFKQLLGVDISTAEGRRFAEALIEDLFRKLAAGLLTPEQLGFATFEEAVELLGQMEGLLDQIEDNTEDDGVTQSLVRTVQITELQANELLQIDHAQLIVDEAQLGVQKDILALLDSFSLSGGPSLSAVTTTGPVINLTVNTEVALGAGATEAVAEDIGTAISEQVSVQLGEALRERRRLFQLRD